jgi:hypothetical protein
MLEKYFESRFTLKQLRSGPGGAWIDSFAESLHDDSYSWWTSRAYLRGAHHFSQFLEGREVGLTRFGGRFRYAAFFTECISSNSIGLL